MLMVISSTVLGMKWKRENIINRAIYGLIFPGKFKPIKVAHIPLDKQLYAHRWLRGGKACSTQLHKES